ncbi:hypothetical protein J6524_28150 [Bradyrhizobium sp. WSM 1738]|uniref:hypothetical protein n=1 Tax=Bradyrhizobium hereditatis TaxID=2821405 RepID=UPI001CE27639|nr:hypothetical protein [Bradyrhizobium hereditatis]MCA6118721.1 hypothetical protein [Bradyrhizobium hereditatis]
MEEATVAEVGPMEDMRPVERMTMYEAVSATMEGGRWTKTATVDRHSTTPEATAVKSCAATAEATAVKGCAATAEAAAMKCRSAAAETAAMETAATAAAKTAAGHSTAAYPGAVLNLGRHSVGYIFR